MKSVVFLSIRVAALVCSSALVGGAIATNPAIAGTVKAFLSSCNSANPCFGWVNNGTGNAIVGDTKNPSGSSHVRAAGIKGNDTSADGGSQNVGVFGTSQAGGGVLGTSVTGTGIVGSSVSGLGLEAVSTHNTGVKGITQSGNRIGPSEAGVYGLDDSTVALNNIGVKGFSTNGTGVLGQTKGLDGSDSVAGVVGLAEDSDGAAPGVLAESINDAGVITSSVNGDGLIAFSAGGEGVFAEAARGVSLEGFDDVGDGAPAVEADGGTTDPATDSFVTFDSAESPTFWVDNGGSAHVRGLIFTSGPCSAGCARTKNSPAKVVQRYVPQESMPTMEDDGEGRLSGGSAFVRIDSAFANVIDSSSNYLVFITPQGPTHGLYVTDKTAAGFQVVEDGGHSSVAFDYRIVAKPFGVTAHRLPMLPSSVLPSASERSHRVSHMRHMHI